MSEWCTRPHRAEDYGSAGTHERGKTEGGECFWLQERTRAGRYTVHVFVLNYTQTHKALSY